MTVYIPVTPLDTPWDLLVLLGAPSVPLATPLVALDTIVVPVGTPSVPPPNLQSEVHLNFFFFLYGRLGEFSATTCKSQLWL